MPCSTMFENAALLVSAAVELYFIKIYGGGGYGFLQEKALWAVNMGFVPVAVKLFFIQINGREVIFISFYK